MAKRRVKRPKGRIHHKAYTWVPKKGPLKGKRITVPAHWENHK